MNFGMTANGELNNLLVEERSGSVIAEDTRWYAMYTLWIFKRSSV